MAYTIIIVAFTSTLVVVSAVVGVAFIIIGIRFAMWGFDKIGSDSEQSRKPERVSPETPRLSFAQGEDAGAPNEEGNAIGCLSSHQAATYNRSDPREEERR